MQLVLHRICLRLWLWPSMRKEKALGFCLIAEMGSNSTSFLLMTHVTHMRLFLVLLQWGLWMPEMQVVGSDPICIIYFFRPTIWELIQDHSHSLNLASRNLIWTEWTWIVGNWGFHCHGKTCKSMNWKNITLNLQYSSFRDCKILEECEFLYGFNKAWCLDQGWLSFCHRMQGISLHKSFPGGGGSNWSFLNFVLTMTCSTLSVSSVTCFCYLVSDVSNTIRDSRKLGKVQTMSWTLNPCNHWNLLGQWPMHFIAGRNWALDELVYMAFPTQMIQRQNGIAWKQLDACF